MSGRCEFIDNSLNFLVERDSTLILVIGNYKIQINIMSMSNSNAFIDVIDNKNLFELYSTIRQSFGAVVKEKPELLKRKRILC